MNLKEQIFLELHNKPRTTLIKDLDYDFGFLEEISTIDLPFLTIPFLNASLLDQINKHEEASVSFGEYKWLVESLGIVKPISLKTREDKIKAYNLKKGFSFDFIDWEDRDWLLKLLKFFYIKSLESLKYLNELQQINKNTKKVNNIKKVENTKSKLEVYHLKGCETHVIKRNELLKRRINPKYTLEEFGDFLAERLKNQPVLVAKAEDEQNEEEQINEEIEEQLVDLRKRDDERDDSGNEKGNTMNVG